MAEEKGYTAHDEQSGALKRSAGEGGDANDEVSWELRKENGVIVKGPDLDEWAELEEARQRESEMRYSGQTVADLKSALEGRGVAIAAAAKKEDLVRALLLDDASRPPAEGLPIGYVGDDFKGPGPQWERDVSGAYANRQEAR